ncbi:MAG: AMP nucleosidase [Trueperaceae bacterium]|nr:AMP nucleosidase [Trueperaceae bacterium]
MKTPESLPRRRLLNYGMDLKDNPNTQTTQDTTSETHDGEVLDSNLIYRNSEKWRIGREFLERYTGTAPEAFQKQIILTNFEYYLERFKLLCDDTEITRGSAMTAAHSASMGVSIINFSIGSPVAALIIEVLATADPKATLFLGICGGLHRSLEVGDFVLPTAAIRDEGASRHFMPPQVPALPTFKIQKFVSQMIVERGHNYRTGVVHTTDYRFWEFNDTFKQQLYEERALAIDMETATLFSVGFASKVPIGAFLLVSDLPLRPGGIKTKESARQVFREYTDSHIELGIQAMSEIAERGEHIRHYRW